MNMINTYTLKLKLILLVLALVAFNGHAEIPTVTYMNSTSTPLFTGPNATPFAKTLNSSLTATKILDGVPNYSWTYGCVPTSVGMLLGYYSLHGWDELLYINVGNTTRAPLSNLQWDIFSSSETDVCPFIASKQNVDFHDKYGHVDDYWHSSGSTLNDPCADAGRTPHPDDCIADYLKANVYEYHIRFDGGARVCTYPKGAPLSKCPDNYNPDTVPTRDVATGIYKYAHDIKHYPIQNIYNQIISGYPGVTAGNGFTFAQYKNEIDNNRPVLIHLIGTKENHTMLGMGYTTNGTTHKIFYYDTWHRDTYYEMVWGGSITNNNKTYTHFAVTVLEFIGHTGISTRCESKKYDHLRNFMQK